MEKTWRKTIPHRIVSKLQNLLSLNKRSFKTSDFQDLVLDRLKQKTIPPEKETSTGEKTTYECTIPLYLETTEKGKYSYGQDNLFAR